MDIYTAAYFAIGLSCLNYTLYQVGREVFYVPTDKNARYKIKAICDTCGYRLGDLTGAMSIGLYTMLFTFLGGLNFLIFALGLVWFPLIMAIGKRYEKKTALKECKFS
jgi:ATP/ADP translocase